MSSARENPAAPRRTQPRKASSQDFAAKLWARLDAGLWAVGLRASALRLLVLVDVDPLPSAGELLTRLPQLEHLLVISTSSNRRRPATPQLTTKPGMAVSFVDLGASELRAHGAFPALAQLCDRLEAAKLDRHLALSITTDAEDSTTGIQIDRAINDCLWGTAVELVSGLRRLCRQSHNGGLWRRRTVTWARMFHAAGHPYLALKLWIMLAEFGPANIYAQAIYTCWAELGCPGPALQWLAHAGEQVQRRELVAGMLDEMQSTQATARARRFQAQMGQLSGAFPELVARLETSSALDAELVWLNNWPWRVGTGAEHNQLQRADYPLFVRNVGAQLHEINPPLRPELRQRLLPQGLGLRPERAMAMHACVASLLQYDVLVNLLRHEARADIAHWQQLLYLIEPELPRLRSLLENVDLWAFLKTRCFHVFAGPDAEAELLRHFRVNPRRALPGLRFGLSTELNLRLQKIEAQRTHAHRARLTKLHAYYDGAFTHTLRDRLKSGSPLRICAWSSRHTTVLAQLASNLVAGFAELGHETELIIEKASGELIDARALSAALDLHRPDLLLLFDHVRPEYGAQLPSGIPVASWIVDELPALSDAQNITKLSARDLCFVWSEAVARHWRRLGYPHLQQLPWAANTGQYHPGIEVNTCADKVAWITNLKLPSEPNWCRNFYAAATELLNPLDELPTGLEAMAKVVSQTCDELGLQLSDQQLAQARYQCNLLSRHLERLRCADRLLAGGVDLALYGRGWTDIPRFRAHARGIVAPGRELCRVYREHKVVLHNNLHCNMHPRVLDAISAGAFVLARSDRRVDRCPGQVNDFLALGRELCVYHDDAEMVALSLRAFEDEDWRRAFIRAGRERVLKEHSYAHRAATILQEMRRIFLAR